MKLTMYRMVCWRTSCLRGFVVIFGLIAVATISAQESKPVLEAAPVPTDPVADARIPDAVKALNASVVTVTRVDSKTGLPSPNPNRQAGFVVDSRGYILTGLEQPQSKAEQFIVRLANLREYIAEVVATDEPLELMMLKIHSPQPLPAISLAKIREPKQGDSVFVVMSPATKGVISGRVTTSSIKLKVAGSTHAIPTDNKLPLGEGGSLLVSELGEPLGIPYAVRSGEEPVCFSKPLKMALAFIKSTTNADVTDEPVAAPTLPASKIQMPDISGEWQKVVLGSRETLVIRRSGDGTADFVIERQWANRPHKTPIKWLAEDGRFHGTFPTPKDNEGKAGGTIALTPSADASVLHVKMSIEAQDMKEFEEKHGTLGAVMTQFLIGTAIDQLATQEWVKVNIPDISGKWRYDVTRIVVGEKGYKPVNATATAVISRVNTSETEFIVVETLGTVQSKWHVKWVPQKRQYEGVSASDGDLVSAAALTLQPHAEGNSIRATFHWSEEIKEHARRHRITEKQLEELQSRELRRVDPLEVGYTLSDPRQASSSKDANNAKMPDISGTWGPFARYDVIIRRTANSDADFEMTTRLLKRFRESDLLREDSIPQKIKWYPDAQHFQTLDSHFRGIATFTMKLNADGKSMRVTLSIDGNPVEKKPGQTSDEMVWVRMEPQSQNSTDLTPLRLPSPPELPRERSVAAPLRHLNIPEARKLSEYIAEHEAKARLIADEIRSLSKTHGTTHPKVIESQRQLNETLASALAAKFKLEQLQITALEENLAKLKSQISQRQAVSKQIVERHAKELLSDPVLEWSPEKTPYKKAGEGAASHGDSAKTSLPTPREIDAQLEPIARRVTSAASRVRTLETQYLRDRSSGVELTKALKDLQQTRSDWSKQVKRLEPTLNLIFQKYGTAKLLAESLSKRLEAVTNQLAEGKATEAEVHAVADEHKRASESFVAADALFESYQTASELYDNIRTGDAEVPTSQEPIHNAITDLEHDPDVALAWLEAATGLKLEFIRFDDLQLWFKAALRVREASGKHEAGDLIVTLNEHRFDSLDQAAEALSRKSRGNFKAFVLRGGLAGHRESVHFNGEPLSRYLRPGDPVERPDANAATIPVEVRVRGEAASGLRTVYLLGTCVAPDGLVVIPVLSKLLVPGEPLIPYGKIRGTARVVATDDAHGLTLVKLESPNQPLFHWWKCHMGSPAEQQRLNCQDEKGKPYDVLVSEIGQPLTKPLVGNDAFIVTGPSVWSFTPGLALKTVDQELQGITIPAELAPVERKPNEDDPGNRKLAIPAVHIEKLIKDYRKASRKSAEGAAVKLNEPQPISF